MQFMTPTSYDIFFDSRLSSKLQPATSISGIVTFANVRLSDQ